MAGPQKKTPKTTTKTDQLREMRVAKYEAQKAAQVEAEKKKKGKK